MSAANLWIVLLPPVLGGVIGYFTNDVAIKMLFSALQAEGCVWSAGFRLPQG